MEAPDRIDTRYLSEDVPFGLATWSALGRLWGVKTPSIDATLTIASVMLERDCFADGLSAEDLGIYHLQPETVCAFVE
jgi:opine dehydrogenase